MRSDQRSGQRRAFALLEAQYYRHLMFASCAWFFEDLDRIEPRNAIGYGLRALREAERVHKLDLLTAYASDLRSARSTETGRTGADLLADAVARATGGSAGRSAATGCTGRRPMATSRPARIATTGDWWW